MSDRPPPGDGAQPRANARSMPQQGDQPIDQAGLSKLKWRCRRGLLENDLFIERFFDRYETTLTVSQADALSRLMELGDNDLLDLLLRRTEPQGEINTSEVRQVLGMLRT
jgi:antitoxin CptB